MNPAFGRASKDARQQRCSLVREMPPLVVQSLPEPSYIAADGCDLAAQLIRGRLAIFLLVLRIHSGADG